MSGPSYSFLLVLLLIIFGFLKLAASASALGSMSAPPVFAMSHDFFCALGISFLLVVLPGTHMPFVVSTEPDFVPALAVAAVGEVFEYSQPDFVAPERLVSI